MVVNEQYIKEKLWKKFYNYDYKLFNVFVFQNESDFLAVSKSGYVWEVEIKVSRADFKNDFKKTDWHRRNKHEKLQSNTGFNPNKFCFAVPAGLITVNEIPDYAGLIYIAKGKGAEIVKQPKMLHKTKLLDNKYFLRQMLNKFYYQNLDLSRRLELYAWERKHKQRRIEFNII